MRPLELQPVGATSLYFHDPSKSVAAEILNSPLSKANQSHPSQHIITSRWAGAVEEATLTPA
jgi:hypothetical protein